LESLFILISTKKPFKLTPLRLPNYYNLKPVDFVFVLEHILKKLLFKKNKLLIYSFNLDIDKVNAVLKDKPHTFFTIQISESLPRFVKIFPRSKLCKHEASIGIIISNRNQLEHGIDLKNMQTKEQLAAVLSNVFPAFLIEAKKVLGALPSAKTKPEKSYSEKDIQNIYDDIVLSKINNYNENPFPTFALHNNTVDLNAANDVFASKFNINSGLYNLLSEQCPRCFGYYFSKKQKDYGFILNISHQNDADLYVCSKCNLELTQLEYDAAQRLKNEGRINIPSVWRV